MSRQDKIKLSSCEASKDRVENTCASSKQGGFGFLFCNLCGFVIGFTHRRKIFESSCDICLHFTLVANRKRKSTR